MTRATTAKMPPRPPQVRHAKRQASVGVFKNNRSQAVHRWYPFIEGFSAELVDDVLRSAPRTTAVFDPFAGCGTTPLAASLRGVSSFFCEVNPYLAWVTDVKINVTRSLGASPDASALLDLAARLDSGAEFRGADSHPLVVADNLRGFFPSGVARNAVGLLDWIDRNLTGPVQELARLACTTSLIPASNMVRRTDLRKRHTGDPAPSRLASTVAEQLRRIHDDCITTAPLLRAPATRIGKDVRSLMASTRKFSLVITSPPYLNGTNYCRNTKLELLALGHLENEQGLRSLRDDCITAGINNVSRRRPPAGELAGVEVVATQLDRVAYDRRIPSLVRSYFSDMRLALRAVRSSSRKGARLMLDIGDSRFAGVHIPTPELLREAAEMENWTFTDRTVLRRRRSYDGTRLVQVLLEFRAT